MAPDRSDLRTTRNGKAESSYSYSKSSTTIHKEKKLFFVSEGNFLLLRHSFLLHDIGCLPGLASLEDRRERETPFFILLTPLCAEIHNFFQLGGEKSRKTPPRMYYPRCWQKCPNLKSSSYYIRSFGKMYSLDSLACCSYSLSVKFSNCFPITNAVFHHALFAFYSNVEISRSGQS